MKRPSREINIFSMSALDLFASAMGAFIFIMVVLVPYFAKTSPTPPQPITCPVPKPCPVCEDKPPCQVCPVPEPSPVCPPVVTPNAQEIPYQFLLWLIDWKPNVDIDLHIVDPRGNEFQYTSKKFPNFPGELSVDLQSGPGFEVWESFEPLAGEYKVYYKYYAYKGTKPTGRFKVRGRLYEAAGKFKAKDMYFSPNELKKKKLVAVFSLDENNRIIVRSGSGLERIISNE